MCPQAALAVSFKRQQGKLCFCLLQIHTVALFPHGAETHLCTIYLAWLCSYFFFLRSPLLALSLLQSHPSTPLLCHRSSPSTSFISLYSWSGLAKANRLSHCAATQSYRQSQRSLISSGGGRREGHFEQMFLPFLNLSN